MVRGIFVLDIANATLDNFGKIHNFNVMIDLHTHSTESDGSFTPAEILKLALAKGLDTVALTDHDTIDGLEAGGKQAELLGIRFIPGIELNINYHGGEFHLLGLNLNKNLPLLGRRLKGIKEKRYNRNLQMVERFNKAGIDITITEVQEAAGGELIVRPHFALVLIKRKIVSSIAEAFDRFIGPGKEFYVERETPDFKEGLSIIKEAGGVAVLAHPGTLKRSFPELGDFLLKHKSIGLEGFEAYHPNHCPEFARELVDFGRRHGFLITGGSDFHGANRPERKLGLAGDGEKIPGWIGTEFLDYIDR